jgi:hypothetical protein
MIKLYTGEVNACMPQSEMNSPHDQCRFQIAMMKVLNKLPVVQHLVFGNLLRCTWTPSPPVGPPSAPAHISPGSMVPNLPHASGGLMGGGGHRRSGEEHRK